MFSLVLTLLAVSAYAGPINLKTAGNFGLLAYSTITNVGLSVIDGDVGSYPTPSVLGFEESTSPGPGKVHGHTYTDANAVVARAKLDLTDAYNEAAGALLPTVLTGQDLGFYNALSPLGPGVYFFADEALLTGNLTLDGGGDHNAQWIFQIGSTLKTATHASVALINGAKKSNVFWQVGSSATIETDSDFAGNIMALTSITLNGGTLNGRALARNGAVTIVSAQIVTVPEPSSIMALGMMLTSAVVLLRRKK